jgi:formate hydrogenlyase subunit 3/multisubunit Na+/H+ antiporter MnhD subunit
MVNPLYLVAILLTAAFLLPFVDKASRKLSLGFLFLSLLGISVLSFMRIWQLLSNPASNTQIYTAGFSAPLSIALSFGLKEAALTLLFNITGMLSGLFLFRKLHTGTIQAAVLLMLILLGANGLVLTRDLFNGFVFLEILSIATYAFIALQPTRAAFASGFKYMLAGGLASSLLLIGIAFIYRYSAALNLDTLIGLKLPMLAGYRTALFLIMMALIIELKPFPANGWALDVYQSAHGGVAALIASVNTGALLYFFYKILHLLPVEFMPVLSITGLLSFTLSNLTALRQKDAARMLGYSSTAQTGLIIFVLTGLRSYLIPQNMVLSIAGGLFITNFLAKAGLFWLTGIVKKEQTHEWGKLAHNTAMQIFFGVFIFALIGLPPFPSFFAKWNLVGILALNQQWVMIAVLLIGSLLEVLYLLRWFGYAVRGNADKTDQDVASVNLTKQLSVLLAASALAGVAFLWFKVYRHTLPFIPFNLRIAYLFPVIGLAVFRILDFLPNKLKGLLAIGFLTAWGWLTFRTGQLELSTLFGLMLVGAAVIQVFSYLRNRDKQCGLYPLLVMLIVAMGNLVKASNNLEFFISWEFLTVASYLLVLRGKNSREPALGYIMFSMAGAYLILTGLALVPGLINAGRSLVSWSFDGLSLAGLIMLGIGFLIKTGTLFVHTWLPETYAEAEDDFTGIMSSVISKAGIFGLLIVLIYGMHNVSQDTMYLILGWLGVLTVFFGSLMAVFQEDVKKLLAYSSMGQVGYIVLSFAAMTHLGWVSGLYMAVNHLLFKALIFTAISAVIMRTGTRYMYEMGGLIKKMPIAYISVLIGIIAASGVPPLTGFGSKWFIYTTLIERGWYLQAGLAFFSSAIAFLYLYKLIHTVFLGQPKPAHQNVKEAPVWMIIPQGVFIMLIMAFSMFPNLLTKPLSALVSNYITRPQWLNWQGYNITLNSPVLHGNWNGNLVMWVTFGVFGVPLLWLLLVNAKTQKVKQFNIVFAAERPYKPWTTHFAHNMFAHYNKALGWLIKPKVTEFWSSVSEWAHSAGATLSYIYTGNGQTYLLHILLYVLVIYFTGGIR